MQFWSLWRLRILIFEKIPHLKLVQITKIPNFWQSENCILACSGKVQKYWFKIWKFGVFTGNLSRSSILRFGNCVMRKELAAIVNAQRSLKRILVPCLKSRWFHVKSFEITSWNWFDFTKFFWKEKKLINLEQSLHYKVHFV